MVFFSFFCRLEKKKHILKLLIKSICHKQYFRFDFKEIYELKKKIFDFYKGIYRKCAIKCKLIQYCNLIEKKYGYVLFYFLFKYLTGKNFQLENILKFLSVNTNVLDKFMKEKKQL